VARRRLSPEAIQQSLNIECPHCHAILGPADRQRVDDNDRVRCVWCGQDFVPNGARETDSN